MKNKIALFLFVGVLIVTFLLYKKPLNTITHSKNKQSKEVFRKNKIEEPIKKIKPVMKRDIVKDKVQIDLDESMIIQDQVQADWSLILFKFFSTKELGMTLNEYNLFREKYSDEYLKALDDFYENLDQGKSQNPTQDIPEIANLKREYHDNLKERLGMYHRCYLCGEIMCI